MSRSLYCAYIACNVRGDRPEFRRRRPVLTSYTDRLSHLLKSTHCDVLCNKHHHTLLAETAKLPHEVRVTATCVTTQTTSMTSAALSESEEDEPTEGAALQEQPLDDAPSSPPSTSLLRSAAATVTPLSVSTTRGGRRTVPTMISQGWCAPADIAAELSRLTAAHRHETGHIWNGSADKLADDADDDDISVPNGEMQQQPYCDLLHTLMTHDNLPADYKLGGRRAGRQFFLDVGSGYGLAALRARIVSGVLVAGGVEVVPDRAFISHRVAETVQLSDCVHFVDASAHSPSVLPILRAATHLFAYSCAFSDTTCSYLAEHVIASSDSNWLVYVTFDKPDVLLAAGMAVQCGGHDKLCTAGGVHWVGHTHSLAMSVSGQKMQANIFVRCTPPDAVNRQRRLDEGVQLLCEKSAASRERGEQEMAQLLASTKTETRAAKRKRLYS